MAKEKENKKPAENAAEPQDFKVNNHVDEESLVEAAVADMKKEEADKKKREIKDAIGLATYQNVKTRAELRARRREDDITKEKLDGTKKLLERVIGFETEIVNGRLVPTKNKCKEPVLTPVEYKEEKRKLNEEIEKKISESNKQLRKDLEELRASYEGRYQYWWE
jgi:hypothetical protein